MNRKNAFTHTCHSEGKARRISERLNNLAFTLVELLTVIAIMTVLAGLLLPALTKARQKAKVAKCISTISSLQTALSMYQVDYGMYPASSVTGTQRNGNSHHSDFDGAPNNFVAAMTARTLGGPYIEFKGKDLLESGTDPENMYVLKDPWGQAYIYVARRAYNGNNAGDGPFHPDTSDVDNNTYNIYSLGPDKKTDDDDNVGGEISYSSGDNWDESQMYDDLDCGNWNDSDIKDDRDNARYDDINSWDGSRSF
jgi:prepilin-type N-terminal cleavage/methylation domain-containing protein